MIGKNEMIRITAIVCASFCVTCEQQKYTFTDTRDSKVYKTIKIGEQVWLAQNLSYDANGSKCYDNNSDNCKKYGRLYNWETAMKSCPNDWHLPSKAEWDVLTEAALDEFFSPPGGYGYLSGYFYDVGNLSYWWSVSEFDSYIKSLLRSVRCVKGVLNR